MLISMIFGYALLFVGIGIFIHGCRELYRAQLKKRLAVAGLYGLVRHPRYTGLFRGPFGEGVVHLPTLFSVGPFLAIVLIYMLLARREEKRMLGEFGVEYRACRNHVSKLFPRSGHWRQLVDRSNSKRNDNE